MCADKYKEAFLLSGSLAFYLWGEPIFCIIAILSAGLDYILCKKIYAAGVLTQRAKQYLFLGIVCNLALLFYYKYTNFFLTSFTQFDPINIILPIGVSFIVFEKITYLVDVYRGLGTPAKGIVKYFNYVFLFPKLLAGPIIKYHEIEAQLHQQCIRQEQSFIGLKRFIGGLSKKIFIADVCGTIVNQIFSLNASELSFSYAWLGIICFTLQIYFDFSGYSDMALGLARMLGFELRENFNFPYTSKSFTEFWRRWHISLSTWIREYLYIPLGGSHVATSRLYINLWICFLLSGLWHGASWTFVLWGAYNGLFLIVDRIFWLKLHAVVPNYISVAVTLILVMFGWVIFRSADFGQMAFYFAALFSPFKASRAYVDVTLDIKFIIALGTLLALAPLFPSFTRIAAKYSGWNRRIKFENFLYCTLGFLALCKLVGATYTPFLYFKF